MSLEKASSSQVHAPLPQAQAGVFNFGPSNNVASGDAFQEEIRLGGQGLSGKERADKIYLAGRGRTSSALEGELVASMTHKRPLCLYEEGSKLARLDQGFAMCKTYEQWIGAGDHVCYRDELTTQIQNYTDGIM